MNKLATLAAVMGLALGVACSALRFGDVEHGSVAFAVSPDGQHVVFAAADGDLYLLSLGTQRVSSLTRTEETESTPAFSPDGRAVIYQAMVPGRKGACLFVRTLDGKRVQQLTNEPSVSDSLPCYSPDGKQVAFVRAHRYRPYSMGGWTWDNFDVYVMSHDGTNQRRVTRHDYYQAGNPCFTADGKTILFSACGDYPDTRTYLFTVPADGARPPERLTTPPNSQRDCAAWVSEPSASPDGKRLAFISDRAESFRYDVLTMGHDGTDIRPLGVTKISRYNQKPVFLPDGKRIMFLAGTEWNSSSRPIFSLWQVDIDGSNPRRIADSRLFTDPLHWLPPADKTRPSATEPRGTGPR